MTPKRLVLNMHND